MNNCASMLLVDVWICFHRWSTRTLKVSMRSHPPKPPGHLFCFYITLRGQFKLEMFTKCAESLNSAVLSLKAGYRRAVLGTTNLSNGKGNFGRTGPTGQSGPPSKLVPNIPVGPNRNGPFYLMYQPKLLEFGVEWKAPTERSDYIAHFKKSQHNKF